jgi:hypothetical protein
MRVFVSSFLLWLCFPASFADAVPMDCRDLWGSHSKWRERTFVRGYEKRGLLVAPHRYTPSLDEIRRTLESAGVPAVDTPPLARQIARRIAETRVYLRRVIRTGSLRGNATRTEILYHSEPNGRVHAAVGRFAVGDPRTPRGRHNLSVNEDIALQTFRMELLELIVEDTLANPETDASDF